MTGLAGRRQKALPFVVLSISLRCFGSSKLELSTTGKFFVDHKGQNTTAIWTALILDAHIIELSQTAKPFDVGLDRWLTE